MGKIKDMPAGARVVAEVGAESRLQESPFPEPALSPGARTAPPGARAALTWSASCVYSALFRRVDVARRVLSCLPACRVRVPPISLGKAGRSPPEGLNRVSS